MRMLEIHMLKNYPPVNLNRDDSGAPKTCFFGGVQRGRISSQCLKHSWRMSDMFKALGSTGIRTRHMPERVCARLRKEGIAEEYLAIAERMLTGLANKEGKENAKGNYTTQIVIYSPEDIDSLAQAVREAIESDGSAKKFKERKAKDFAKMINDAELRPITADIALFGRMVTSECFADVDASMQVAHAISTHAVSRESDYFTAVDDLLTERDEIGAGMMGDIDYNSCCYYEYASLDIDQLRKNLCNSDNAEALVEKLLPVLLRAMVFTNPSGKQNSFAGQVLPSMILIECKDEKIPLSYVNAFETPVPLYGAQPKLVEKSIQKLIDEVNNMDAVYSLNVKHRIWMSAKPVEAQLGKGEKMASFKALTDAVSEWLKEEKA